MKCMIKKEWFYEENVVVVYESQMIIINKWDYGHCGGTREVGTSLTICTSKWEMWSEVIL